MSDQGKPKPTYTYKGDVRTIRIGGVGGEIRFLAVSEQRPDVQIDITEWLAGRLEQIKSGPTPEKEQE